MLGAWTDSGPLVPNLRATAVIKQNSGDGFASSIHLLSATVRRRSMTGRNECRVWQSGRQLILFIVQQPRLLRRVQTPPDMLHKPLRGTKYRPAPSA